MKLISSLLLVLFFGPIAGATPPFDVVPSLTLTDGSTLKNFHAVSFGATTVMAKWDGGRGTVAYEKLPEEFRILAEKQRPKPSAIAAPRSPKKKEVAPPVVTQRIRGQVYTITRGAGAYKHPGATVHFYDYSIWETAHSVQRASYQTVWSDRKEAPILRTLRELSAWRKALAAYEPVAVATTDADGNFDVSLKAGTYFVFCTVTREVVRETEVNLWVLPVAGERLDLNSRNEWDQN